MKKQYSKSYKMGVFTISPKHSVYYEKCLFTRLGKKVKVIESNAFWLKGTIKGKEYVWLDTGNYIGSNYPHNLDIDWKRSREYEQKLNKKSKAKTV